MKKIYILLFSLAALISANASGADKLVICGPYLQNPFDFGMTVMWHTSAPSFGWVEYGTDTTALKTARLMVDGQAVDVTSHKVRLSGLRSGETYYYRIISKEVLSISAKSITFGRTEQSAFHTFHTQGTNGGDLNVVVFNDIHDIPSEEPVVIENMKKLIFGKECDFVIFNGDCIPDAPTTESAIASLARLCDLTGASERPFLYVKGNHETRGPVSTQITSFFDYPQGHPYGSFSLNNNRFVFFDTGDQSFDGEKSSGRNNYVEYRKKQLEFLKSEITDDSFLWASKRILVGHLPLYSGYENLFADWFGILDRAPFDLYCAAHTHEFSFNPSRTKHDNPFPFFIGGGSGMESATVAFLACHGGHLSIKVVGMDGNVLCDEQMAPSINEIKITAPIGEAYPYLDNVRAYVDAGPGAQVENHFRGDENPCKDILVTWTNTYDCCKGSKLLYATKPDFSDADSVITDWKTSRAHLRNLYRDTKYYLRVYPLVSGKDEYAEVSFTTMSDGPRVMSIPNLYNVRDAGGYLTISGKRTRQGLVFRGSELNDPTCGQMLNLDGDHYMSEVLCIAHDMDLRAAKERGGITESPITSATYRNYPASAYDGIFSKENTGVYRDIFKALANPDNYPVYIHCKAGADRTGTVCYLLNALLGVPEEDLVRDYEFTTFSHVGVRSVSTDKWQRFVKALDDEKGDTLAEKVEYYLLGVGVTEKEIKSIRNILLEDHKKN